MCQKPLEMLGVHMRCRQPFWIWLIFIQTKISFKNVYYQFQFSFLSLSIYDNNGRIDFMYGKSIFFIVVQDEVRLFINKKVILNEKQNSVSLPSGI
jgi:hypothetical protein